MKQVDDNCCDVDVTKNPLELIVSANALQYNDFITSVFSVIENAPNEGKTVVLLSTYGANSL